MKYLVLGLLYTTLMVNGEKPKTKTNSNEENTDYAIQKTNNAAARAVAVISQPPSKGEQNDHAQEPPNYLSRLFSPENIPTIALVVVGILTFGAIWYQAKKTAEATQTMRDSLPLQKSAADAALLNAQAAIAAARPWVSFFGTYNSRVFTFKAANLGNTPAEVVSYASGMMLVDRVENLPIPPNYGKDQTPPLAFLTPSQTADGASITLGTYDTNSIPAPDPKKQIFAFFFRVVYKNPLTSANHPLIPQHESRMCFWYDKTGGYFPQAGGPQEYNKHT